MVMEEVDICLIPGPSLYHNQVELGRFLGLAVYDHERRGHVSQTIHFNTYKHGVRYIIHLRLSQEAIQRSVRGKKIKTLIKDFSYIHIKIILIILIQSYHNTLIQ